MRKGARRISCFSQLGCLDQIGANKLFSGLVPRLPEIRRSALEWQEPILVLIPCSGSSWWVLKAVRCSRFGRLIALRKKTGHWIQSSTWMFTWNKVDAGKLNSYTRSDVPREHLASWDSFATSRSGDICSNYRSR